MRFLRAPIACGSLAGYVASRREGLDSHDILSSEELAAAAATTDTVDLLLRSDPEMVALSVYLWNAIAVAEIVAELRRRHSGAVIVLGGPDVQYTPDIALRRFQVDFICTGEGELAFLGLVEKLSSNRSNTLHHPPAGIASRWRNGGPAPLVAELDTIPSPFRDGIIDIPDSGWVDLETIRGCPFSCSFCLYGKNLEKVRTFSLERVRSDVEWVLERGATNLYFLDPTFNLPRERCRAILDMLAELNGERRACIGVEARAEAVDDDLADRMAAAGIVSVEVGLQAVQPSVLQMMRRGLGRKGFVSGCQRLRERGIGVDIGIILGLPGDTVQTIRETISYVTQDLLGEVSAYRLRVLPGSDYWNRAAELGLECTDEPPYFIQQTPLLPAHALDALEAEVTEVVKAHNRAYRTVIDRSHLDLMAKLAKKAAKQEPARDLLAT
jgi:radical SAM superfamily enzyme YgiQ (UPF0313 family)